MSRPDVLVTGAAGALGSRLLARLADQKEYGTVLAADVREIPSKERLEGVHYLTLDVRDPALVDAVAEHTPEVIVHLAAIVTPGPQDDRELQYSVDVGGTENVLRACLAGGVKRLIISSSGAAYGYHADNPRWLREHHALRGNDAFAYARHKRLVEEMLAENREEHPEIEQVIFRIGTILGDGMNNQITAFFDRDPLIGVRDGDDRFVFIWDEDAAACFERAITSEVTGIFNLVGDGALTMTEIAQRMDKRYLRLPAALMRSALAIAKPLRLSPYGPEQVNFVRYRPVLDNSRLKEVFGFVPRMTSSEVFDHYLECRRRTDGA